MEFGVVGPSRRVKAKDEGKAKMVEVLYTHVWQQNNETCSRKSAFDQSTLHTCIEI
jgi:hypothetical protein